MTKYYLTIAFLIIISSVSSHGQTATFTFQGRLTDTSMPASGTYQMQFALYDAANAGTQIGSMIENTAVSVSNSTFTVQLNYGAGAFSGAERYLEISVRRNSGESYVALAPRQRITSSPHAIRAANAATADNASSLGGMPAASYVQSNDARLSDARTPTPGSGNYIQNQVANSQAASFNINGSGFAQTLSAGSVNVNSEYRFQGTRILTAPSASQNLFVGREAGFSNTTGTNNTFIGSLATGYANTTGSNNTLVGAGAGVGPGNLQYATAVGAGALVLEDNTVVLGRSSGQDTVIASGLLHAQILSAESHIRMGVQAAGNVTCASSTAGYMIYNGAIDAPQYCNGTEWRTVASTSGLSPASMETKLRVQQRQIDELKQIVCGLKPDAEVCKEVIK